MDEAFFKDDTLSSEEFQWGKGYDSKIDHQLFSGGGDQPATISSQLYKNPFIKSDAAMEAMYNLSTWEFENSQKLQYDKIKDHEMKCACGTSWRRRKDPKIKIPGQWIQCPFKHNDGSEYLADPLPKRKLDPNRGNRGFRTMRKKEHPQCTHCMYTKFHIHKDPSMYYQDYLEQTFHLRNSGQENEAICPRKEIKEGIEAAFAQNSINNKEEKMRRLSKVLLNTEVLHPSTPPNWFEELLDLLDPQKHLKGIQEDNFNSPTKVAKSRYALSSTSKKTRIKSASTNPNIRRPNSSGKFVIGKKLNLKLVKSRYLKFDKTDDEESIVDNPFPMPGDKITRPKPHQNYLKKSSNTPQLKSSKLSISKADVVTNELMKPSNLPKQIKISPRLESLSKPVKRTPKLTVGTKKRTQTKLSKPKSANNGPSEKKTIGTIKKTRKAKPKTPKAISHYGDLFSKIRPKKSGKGKKNKVLQAFGFEFCDKDNDDKCRNAGNGAEDTDTDVENGQSLEHNFSKEKYRRYVLRMLEKSKETREAQIPEDTDAKERNEKIVLSSPRKPKPKKSSQKEKSKTPGLNISNDPVTNKPVESNPEIVPEEKSANVDKVEAYPLKLKTPSTIKLELPTSRIQRKRNKKGKPVAASKNDDSQGLHKYGGDAAVSIDAKNIQLTKSKNSNSHLSIHSSGSGGDNKLLRKVADTQVQDTGNQPLESVMSTSKYYKLNSHTKNKILRGRFYSSAHLTPRFPIKTLLPTPATISQEFPSTN